MLINILLAKSTEHFAYYILRPNMIKDGMYRRDTRLVNAKMSLAHARTHEDKIQTE